MTLSLHIYETSVYQCKQTEKWQLECPKLITRGSISSISYLETPIEKKMESNKVKDLRLVHNTNRQRKT